MKCKTILVTIGLFIHLTCNAQDTVKLKRKYAYASLLTSLDFVGGALNYGIEKKRVGYEFGIHYPLLTSTVERSVFGNMGLNFGVYYHNKPVDDGLQIALVSKYRAIHIKTKSVIDLLEPWQPIAPPFYKFRRYWMEGYGGAMITHYFLPRVYVRFEIYVGYMLEYKKNLDGLVSEYSSWTTGFLQQAQAGFRYELFR